MTVPGEGHSPGSGEMRGIRGRGLRGGAAGSGEKSVGRRGAPRPLPVLVVVRKVPWTPLSERHRGARNGDSWTSDACADSDCIELVLRVLRTRAWSLSTCLPPWSEEIPRFAKLFSVFSNGSQSYYGILILNPEILMFWVWRMAGTPCITTESPRDAASYVFDMKLMR